jgi:gliding motility-associated-like protein
LQLQASGTGNFSWTPQATMINANSNSPSVSPTANTRYYVTLETDGCVNNDSVNVRVADRVNLQVMKDTIICSGDTIQLNVISDALTYTWTPAAQFINPSVQDPLAITQITTPYQVTARIGGCSIIGNITVSTVPYPIVDAGRDTTICYNTGAQLQASTNGSSWQWKAVPSLSNAALLNPVANPANTIEYIFSAYNAATSGCPKPSTDTVLVTVLPRIIASAGEDTTVVIGQPLQLNATGGNSYSWSPPIALSSGSIANPVALFYEPSTGVRYQVTVFNSVGCFDTASLVIKIFATLPTVFVPNAFTPNSDGNNDVLRPIVAGMKQFDYFNVYNRWGQLVFSTSANGHGWDGTINGAPQASNAYVWIVKAVDFNGVPYFKKGTVTLIR